MGTLWSVWGGTNEILINDELICVTDRSSTDCNRPGGIERERERGSRVE